MMTYRDTIASLISSFPIEIDTDIQLSGRRPTMASSNFLINKEQGDWAEQIVLNAVNTRSTEYCAVQYGRSDDFAAGEPGFEEFYSKYQDEVKNIGKKPDLLIFRRSDAPNTDQLDIDHDIVRKAIAAIEVRSSSFLANKYASFMNNRIREAEAECSRIQGELMQEPLSSLLLEKSPELHRMIKCATVNTFRELDFRARSWSSSSELKRLSQQLKNLKGQITILHKRENLSITPKLEDLALVNRWIQHFGVKHFYLQVFFDKAYVLPFKDILTVSSDPKNEGIIFSVDQDSRNQGKTTIKIDIQVGKEILGRVDMPEHRSALKEFDQGRLLFYVTFHGGRGYLDPDIFEQEIIDHV